MSSTCTSLFRHVEADEDNRWSVSAANSDVITKRRAVLWAMERGMSGGFDAAVVAGKGRAVPLEVSFEAASIALSVFVLQSWLVRRVPVVSAGIGFLEGVIPMPEFVEAIFVRVLEVREPFEEILPEFPVVDVGDWSRSDSL